MRKSDQPAALGLGEGLGPTLRRPGVWVWHDTYSRAEPAGYTRSSAPFEAADMLDMQAREIALLRAALARLEAACDARAGLLTPAAYCAADEIAGMRGANYELDDARRAARLALGA